MINEQSLSVQYLNRNERVDAFPFKQFGVLSRVQHAIKVEE